MYGKEFWRGLSNGFIEGLGNMAVFLMVVVITAGFFVWPSFNSNTVTIGLFILSVAMAYNFYLALTTKKDTFTSKVKKIYFLMSWMCWGMPKGQNKFPEGLRSDVKLSTWYHCTFLVVFNSFFVTFAAKLALHLPWQPMPSLDMIIILTQCVYILVVLNFATSVVKEYKFRNKGKQVTSRMWLRIIGVSFTWPVFFIYDIESHVRKRYY